MPWRHRGPAMIRRHRRSGRSRWHRGSARSRWHRRGAPSPGVAGSAVSRRHRRSARSWRHGRSVRSRRNRRPARRMGSGTIPAGAAWRAEPADAWTADSAGLVPLERIDSTGHKKNPFLFYHMPGSGERFREKLLSGKMQI